VAARTPAEASEKVQEDKPDLVLLDLDINGQGALEFAEKLRDDANTKGIPVVAIAQEQASRDKALGSGCEAFVTKPFKIRELEALVTKLLSNA
jgi:CheY-like chemotaxis protein